MPAPLTFSFLGETRCVPEGPWATNASPLWNYNVNYFDDLNAVEAVSRRAWHAGAMAKWVRFNPPGIGDAWAPYPTSLRIVNWIKWVMGGGMLEPDALHSLAIQVRALEQRLEYHLLGNHLFANAKALIYAGLYFEGAEAEGWIQQGLAILAREMPEQILEDGGQFERSPMYHALAFEDVLDLVNLAAAFRDGVPGEQRVFIDTWPTLAQEMRDWLRAMCHPDGEISFFNDAAIGIAPSPAELERYADGLLGSRNVPNGPASDVVRLRRLTASGYVRAHAPNAVLLMDVAPVGPDYLPGHAHADTLSFELSLFGQRVIVNGGTSRYGLGSEREAERGTPAHSTVTVDGENSSEVWAGFRVGRRARPFDLFVQEEAGSVQVACAHDGYRRLRGRPVHRRSWCMEPGVLRVEDRVEGGIHSAVARFHLHPSVAITVDVAGDSGTLGMPGGRAVRWRAIRGKTHVEDSVFCPEFGRRDPTRCLAVNLDSHSGSCLELAW